jgi:hypothetical protein
VTARDSVVESGLPAAALLAALAAEPRPTGGRAAAQARELCKRELQALGYEIRERPFDFSAFPGRLATPLIGGAAAMAVGLAGQRGATGERFPAMLVLAIATPLLIAAAVWLTRRGVLDAPVMRMRGVNLEASRRGETPSVWISAHVDTKSQPLPTIVRSAGIVVEGIGYLLAIVLAVVMALGVQLHPASWVYAALLTLVGAVPVVLSVVGSRSPGALDNASGVVAAIETARLLSASGQRGIGILMTDAEEMGLAGARAWSRENPAQTTVLNFDGVDDDGRIEVMLCGDTPAWLREAVARGARETAIDCHVGRMFPGLLTDSVAFADAGLPTVTFSRGTFRSLARVHSARDNLSNLRGTGIAETSRLAAATASSVVQRETTGWK